MILIVGATGQLGSQIARGLIDKGRPVRALVRRSSRYGPLAAAGAELAFGDLRDPDSLVSAVRGVTTVVATASGIAPGADGGDVVQVDRDGYAALIEACRLNGVRHFLYASVPVGKQDGRVALTRAKRETERLLLQSGMSYTIFRLGMFADVCGALLGSRLPESGASASTLQRPFWFIRSFRRVTGELIEKRGIALVPGRGDVRVSFITVQDVARIMVAAVDHPDAIDQVFEVGGSEILTFDETLRIYERVLNRPVRASYAPPAQFRILQLLLRPISRSAASLMGLNWLTATGSQPAPDPERSREVAARFGVTLTPFEEFLRAKAGQPSASPAEA